VRRKQNIGLLAVGVDSLADEDEPHGGKPQPVGEIQSIGTFRESLLASLIRMTSTGFRHNALRSFPLEMAPFANYFLTNFNRA
jgi:hypothetical protein